MSFGRSPKPKPFGFIPRFYDEQKEEREKRLKKLENTNDIDLAKDRIKSGLRATYRGDANYKKAQTRRSNVRLIYIIIALIIMAILFMKSSFLDTFMKYIYG